MWHSTDADTRQRFSGASQLAPRGFRILFPSWRLLYSSSPKPAVALWQECLRIEGNLPPRDIQE